MIFISSRKNSTTASPTPTDNNKGGVAGGGETAPTSSSASSSLRYFLPSSHTNSSANDESPSPKLKDVSHPEAPSEKNSNKRPTKAKRYAAGSHAKPPRSTNSVLIDSTDSFLARGRTSGAKRSTSKQIVKSSPSKIEKLKIFDFDEESDGEGDGGMEVELAGNLSSRRSGLKSSPSGSAGKGSSLPPACRKVVRRSQVMGTGGCVAETAAATAVTHRSGGGGGGSGSDTLGGSSPKRSKVSIKGSKVDEEGRLSMFSASGSKRVVLASSGRTQEEGGVPADMRMDVAHSTSVSRKTRPPNRTGERATAGSVHHHNRTDKLPPSRTKTIETPRELSQQSLKFKRIPASSSSSSSSSSRPTSSVATNPDPESSQEEVRRKVLSQQYLSGSPLLRPDDCTASLESVPDTRRSVVADVRTGGSSGGGTSSSKEGVSGGVAFNRTANSSRGRAVSGSKPNPAPPISIDPYEFDDSPDVPEMMTEKRPQPRTKIGSSAIGGKPRAVEADSSYRGKPPPSGGKSRTILEADSGSTITGKPQNQPDSSSVARSHSSSKDIGSKDSDSGIVPSPRVDYSSIIRKKKTENASPSLSPAKPHPQAAASPLLHKHALRPELKVPDEEDSDMLDEIDGLLGERGGARNLPRVLKFPSSSSSSSTGHSSRSYDHTHLSRPLNLRADDPDDAVPSLTKSSSWPLPSSRGHAHSALRGGGGVKTDKKVRSHIMLVSETSLIQWTPSNLATLGTSQSVPIRGGGLISGVDLY